MEWFNTSLIGGAGFWVKTGKIGLFMLGGIFGNGNDIFGRSVLHEKDRL